MKIEDIRTKSEDELEKMVVDLAKTQMNLRFQKAGAQLQDTSQIRKNRRDIARIKTVLQQKQEADKKTA